MQGPRRGSRHQFTLIYGGLRQEGHFVPDRGDPPQVGASEVYRYASLYYRSQEKHGATGL